MMPISPLVERGRFLQAAAGVLLQASPFLYWAKVPVFGLSLGVPGVFMHGGVLLAIGFTITVMMLVKVRHPGVSLLLGLSALGVSLLDLRHVVERTAPQLQHLQDSLAGLNYVLGRFNVAEGQVLPPGIEGWDWVDVGAWMGLGASVAVVLGGLAEMLGYRRGKRMGWVLVGLPRCRGCGVRVGWDMSYCPGCALPQRPGTLCGGCGGWMDDWHRFCPSCARPRGQD